MPLCALPRTEVNTPPPSSCLCSLKQRTKFATALDRYTHLYISTRREKAFTQLFARSHSPSANYPWQRAEELLVRQIRSFELKQSATASPPQSRWGGKQTRGCIINSVMISAMAMMHCKNQQITPAMISSDGNQAERCVSQLQLYYEMCVSSLDL